MYHENETAILFGIELPDLAELRRLSETAGARVVGEIAQKRSRPDQKYFIGSGKLEELKAQIAATGANLVLFDVSLSPSQERNLEEALGVKVLDRTELILDIFAQHAHSREGKLQVELAQSTFLLTRLSGQGEQMSRLGGGIGTRGPGETKLEYDRRMIRKRISELKKEIENIRRERELRREKRKKGTLPLVALVGYTNSGKSTLLNALSGSKVLTQNKLFATLDPTVRKLYLSEGKNILLTDTVGFIQKLPHPLIAAFSATLEEVTEADLLLHVVDLSHPYFESQIQAVFKVLWELKAETRPILTVFNKIDIAEKKVTQKLLEKYHPAVAVSAYYRRGLDELKAGMARLLFEPPPRSAPDPASNR